MLILDSQPLKSSLNSSLGDAYSQQMEHYLWVTEQTPNEGAIAKMSKGTLK